MPGQPFRINHQWQTFEDETMRALYTAGETWGAIAKAFGLSRGSVQAHGAKLGLTWRSPPQGGRNGARPEPLGQTGETVAGIRLRPPLAAGHPVSWGAIVIYTPTIWGMDYDRWYRPA